MTKVNEVVREKACLCTDRRLIFLGRLVGTVDHTRIKLSHDCRPLQSVHFDELAD